MKKFSRSTKKGVASLYVVVFATILFGVITLSFVRIIISEASQTSNDDLSQSAYDAALAGVEDAKIAVNKYYQCINKGGTPSTCGDLFGGDCDTFKLKTYLYGDSYGDGEVLIQESNTSNSGSSNSSEQAYTCTILSNVVGDYRSTLTSDTRTRVVPIGIGAQTQLEKISTIEFGWYSEINGTVFRNLEHNGSFSEAGNATTPPTISLTLLYTDPEFKISDFYNSTSGSYSTMILLPSDENNANAITEIGQNSIALAGNSDKLSEGIPKANDPFQIKCYHGQEFACKVKLAAPKFTNGGNALLIVSLPYGDTVTDFAVTLKDANGNPIDFENVQVSVDSTGRANQLVRRVESRLDPADIFFPYPQYEVELNGGNEVDMLKYYWITANCWTEKGTCPNNGKLNVTSNN